VSAPRFCYYVSIHEHDEKGYVPSVVYEDQDGHFPLRGNQPFQQPWYVGTSYSEARAVVAKFNEELGLSPIDVIEIIAASMGKGNWEEG